jgi:hypothetical protein
MWEEENDAVIVSAFMISHDTLKEQKVEGCLEYPWRKKMYSPSALLFA